MGSLWNRNELRLCADAYIIKYDMHTQHTHEGWHNQHTHTGPKWSQCMRTCCSHPTAPIPTYQIRPGTNHKTSYSYISYIPSNSFIVYRLRANPSICRSAGQSQVTLRVARGAANAWAAANSSLAQQEDPLGSELAIWQSSMIFHDFNRPNSVSLCLSYQELRFCWGLHVLSPSPPVPHGSTWYVLNSCRLKFTESSSQIEHVSVLLPQEICTDPEGICLLCSTTSLDLAMKIHEQKYHLTPGLPWFTKSGAIQTNWWASRIVMGQFSNATKPKCSTHRRVTQWQLSQPMALPSAPWYNSLSRGAPVGAPRSSMRVLWWFQVASLVHRWVSRSISFKLEMRFMRLGEYHRISSNNSWVPKTKSWSTGSCVWPIHTWWVLI